jgi:hypothetical protein
MPRKKFFVGMGYASSTHQSIHRVSIYSSTCSSNLFIDMFNQSIHPIMTRPTHGSFHYGDTSAGLRGGTAAHSPGY